jgi:RpiB/LacA/LacB family sugar-phosphate isomerase
MSQDHYLIIPLAGMGERFRRDGYTTSKHMLKIGMKSTLEFSLDSINLNDFKIIFIIREDQAKNSEYIKFIEELCHGNHFEIKIIEGLTRGSLETVLKIQNDISANSKISIFTTDVHFTPKYNGDFFGNYQGGILTFKSNSPNYSYARIEDQFVQETAEKKVISNDAIVGIYYFSKAELFFKNAQIMINENNLTNNEFYIAPLYNYLISQGMDIYSSRIENFYVFGTPREFEFFSNFVKLERSNLRIGLVSDHSGYHLKEKVRKILQSISDVSDYGTFTNDNTDYNEWVMDAVEALQNGQVDLIIASCYSGNGVNIVANKHNSVIGCLVYDIESAELSQRHSSANFVALPDKIWRNSEDLEKCLRVLVNTHFEGGRHQLRLMKALELPNANF